MKRNITSLEQELINNGWYLTNKRYKGKHSEKILSYEYHKTSDLRNDNKVYDQVIVLNQKRSQIVNYGIKNVYFDFVGDQELCLLRFLHLELKHFVERITTKKEPCNIYSGVVVPNDENEEKEGFAPMTFEQLDELCKEKEK